MLRKILNYVARKRTELAFKSALKALPQELGVSELSPTVKLFNPRLPRSSYSIKQMVRPFSCRYRLAPSTRYSRHNKPTKLKGVILAVISEEDKPVQGTRIGLPFYDSVLDNTIVNEIGTIEHIFFTPEAKLIIPLPFRNKINAFSHVVLLMQGNRAIVFVPTLQKITGESKREKRLVDQHVGSYGPDRHLLFLHLAEKIVEHMRKNGINAELHVPNAIHFHRSSDLAVNNRIRMPFLRLAEYFEPSSIEVEGVKLKTTNLSKPLK